MHLLVLGASGGCGRWVCTLAPQRGHTVRALVREGTPFAPLPSVSLARGSVLDPDTLDRALDGCDAVVSALGIKREAPWNPWSALASPPDLTTTVARRLVRAMPEHGLRRCVAISAAGVGDSIDCVNPVFRTLIARSNIGVAYRDLAGMEAALAESDLDWMAVRPVTLINGGPTGRAERVDRYGAFAWITRGDVAAWMLDAVAQPAPFSERTPMIAS